MMREKLKKYIASADEVVGSSIDNMHDIEFDGFNADGCNGYILFGNHKIFRKRVAIKYYYFGEDSHEEVALIKSLNHKNVLHVWDARSVGAGWAYFITDEMTNGTLDTMISASPISTNCAMDIVRGLLSGTGKLHEAPNYLLHRDLKPANILVDSIEQPVIADFGSIKRLPLSDMKVKASKHSALYRPPESYDTGYYTISSDIYQIGLVMYQVLGGVLSYDPLDYMTTSQTKMYRQMGDFDKSKFVDEILYNKAKKAKLINLASLPYFTHPKLINIIRKATNPEPSKRYQNTAEFYLDMHKVGTIPNWRKLSEECILCEFKSLYYRIIDTSKGCIFEKSKDNSSWRKVPGTGYEATGNAVFNKVINMFG